MVKIIALGRFKPGAECQTVYVKRPTIDLQAKELDALLTDWQRRTDIVDLTPEDASDFLEYLKSKGFVVIEHQQPVWELHVRDPHVLPSIYCWTQGGSGNDYRLDRAADYLLSQLDVREFQWEVRDDGEEIFYPTLREALDIALPHWQAIGLTVEQALLTAMAAGRLLSTGINANEDEDHEIDA